MKGLGLMKTKKHILGAVGLNEYAPVKSVLLVILFLSGIGIFTDGLMDALTSIWDFNTNEKYEKIGIGVILFFFVYIFYHYLGRMELQVKKEPSLNKEIMITFFPSNADLLRKIISAHKLKKIYFIKTKNFPPNDRYAPCINLLDKLNIEHEEFYINDKDNPKEIKGRFDEIVELGLDSMQTVINITAGTSVSSIVLYELGSSQKFTVEYLQNDYDKNNQPIQNSEKSYSIDIESEFIQ